MLNVLGRKELFLPLFIGNPIFGMGTNIFKNSNATHINNSEDDYSYFDPRVCVIGLGHTGLVHALAFGENYKTIGYDPDQERVEELRRGHDSLLKVSGELIQHALYKGFSCTSDLEDIRKCNFYVITLPPESVFGQPFRTSSPVERL